MKADWTKELLGSAPKPCEKCEAMRESRNHFRRARTALLNDLKKVRKENTRLQELVAALVAQLEEIKHDTEAEWLSQSAAPKGDEEGAGERPC